MIEVTRTCICSEFVSAMRSRYLRREGELELPFGLQLQLGLHNPTAWTVSKLVAAQAKVAEKLLTYWSVTTAHCWCLTFSPACTCLHQAFVSYPSFHDHVMSSLTIVSSSFCPKSYP